MLTVYIDFKIPDALFALPLTMDMCHRLNIDIDWQPMYCSAQETIAEQAEESKGETHARIKQELADKTHTFYAELYGIDLSPPIEDKDTELALACLLQLNEKKQEFVEACMESYWSNGLSLNNAQSIINILSSLNIKQNIDLSDAAIKALAEHNNNAMADHGFLHSPSYVLDGQVFIGRQHQPLIESMLSTSPD
ncbi:MAG: DsbA family protein [Cellvibrionaceae bacterium]|nr:DsbA family protein [Cellvibrionaceae bacterium]